MLRAVVSWLFVLALLALPYPVLAQVGFGCAGDTYTVQAGDTLFSIAEDCGIEYMGLVGINYQLSDPDKLWPGQVIRLVAGAELGDLVPASGAPVKGGLQADGRTYLVRPGDSLARIAYLYNTSVETLLYLNPEVGPDGLLYVRQRILLPEGAWMQRGWVGVNTLLPRRIEEISVRVQDFPPYANLQFRLGALDMEADVVKDAISDAKGSAEITLKIPLTAVIGEQWVVEVVTVGEIRPVRALSPLMEIQ